jgi:hypothetical protein
MARYSDVMGRTGTSKVARQRVETVGNKRKNDSRRVVSELTVDRKLAKNKKR